MIKPSAFGNYWPNPKQISNQLSSKTKTLTDVLLLSILALEVYIDKERQVTSHDHWNIFCENNLSWNNSRL